MTATLPNPFSPYADADPLYRHLFPTLDLLGAPAPGALAVTSCERLAVVPDEPLRDIHAEGTAPDGLCPLCMAELRGEQRTFTYPASTCSRCHAATRHNGLCAVCRQQDHADWWDTRDDYARPFRVVRPDRTVLDGVRFPNGQAIVIDDPEAGLSSGAPSVEQLLSSYHRSEVIWAADVVRVAGARMHHAVQQYAHAAMELEDAPHPPRARGLHPSRRMPPAGLLRRSIRPQRRRGGEALMTHPYLTVASALAALLFVTTAALRLILKRISARTAIALTAIAAAIGTGANIAAGRRPLSVLGVFDSLVLLAAWATTPTRRQRERNQQLEEANPL